MITVGELKVGTRFRKWDGRIAVVVESNECRVRIRHEDTVIRKERQVVFNAGTEDEKTVTLREALKREGDVAHGMEVLEVLGQLDVVQLKAEREAGRSAALPGGFLPTAYLPCGACKHPTAHETGFCEAAGCSCGIDLGTKAIAKDESPKAKGPKSASPGTPKKAPKSPNKARKPGKGYQGKGPGRKSLKRAPRGL